MKKKMIWFTLIFFFYFLKEETININSKVEWYFFVLIRTNRSDNVFFVGCESGISSLIIEWMSFIEIGWFIDALTDRQIDRIHR